MEKLAPIIGRGSIVVAGTITAASRVGSIGQVQRIVGTGELKPVCGRGGVNEK